MLFSATERKPTTASWEGRKCKMLPHFYYETAFCTLTHYKVVWVLLFSPKTRSFSSKPCGGMFLMVCEGANVPPFGSSAYRVQCVVEWVEWYTSANKMYKMHISTDNILLGEMIQTPPGWWCRMGQLRYRSKRRTNCTHASVHTPM